MPRLAADQSRIMGSGSPSPASRRETAPRSCPGREIERPRPRAGVWIASQRARGAARRPRGRRGGRSHERRQRGRARAGRSATRAGWGLSGRPTLRAVASRGPRLLQGSGRAPPSCQLCSRPPTAARLRAASPESAASRRACSPAGPISARARAAPCERTTSPSSSVEQRHRGWVADVAECFDRVAPLLVIAAPAR